MEKQKTKASTPAKGRSSSDNHSAKKTVTGSKAKQATKTPVKKVQKDTEEQSEPSVKPTSRNGRVTNSDEQRKPVNATENSYDENDEEMEEGTYLKKNEDEDEKEEVSEHSSSNHSRK